MPKKPLYPLAVNALGEILCPGCGFHFRSYVAHHAGPPAAYCSAACRQLVYMHGGRLTWDDVNARIREIVRRTG